MEIVCCELKTNMMFFVFAVFFCGIGGKAWGKIEKQVGCDNRYFQHYLVKGCRPEYGPNGSECPIRFSCPQPAPPETSGCRFQGKLIQPGQDIPTGNPCQLCSCRPGWNGGAPEIVCTGVKCPSAFGPPLDDNSDEVFEVDKSCSTSRHCVESGCRFKGKLFQPGQDIPTGTCQTCSCIGPYTICTTVVCPPALRPVIDDNCYEVFEVDKCCSTSKHCGDTVGPLPTCVHKDETFYAGQQIYPDEDPCVVCTCGKGWTGNVHSDPNCRRHTCLLEKDMKLLTSGCLPIYHESTCCPIEFDCGENLQNKTTPLATAEEIGSGNTCVFKGSHYRIGQLLDISHPTNCVTCTCTTPPEFTCVHTNCV